MILLSYDGSDDARTAIERAATLMPGAEVTVVTVWEPFLNLMARSGALGYSGGLAGDEDVDTASREAAETRANEGAAYANERGLRASARIASNRDGIAPAILAAAAELDAEAIVLGTRGLTGVRSLLLGSVSHAVLQHADRAVMVVPSAPVADGRRDHHRDRGEG